MEPRSQPAPEPTPQPVPSITLERRTAKLPAPTADLVRFAAALRGTTQARILELAIEEFIANHAAEFERDLAKAHELLLAGSGVRELVAQKLGFSEEKLRELGA